MNLPNIICAEDFGGCWDIYLNHLYEIFLDDFVRNPIHFLGFRISCRRTPEHRGKHSGFWHMISYGEVEDDREIEPRRCERLCWVKPLIEAAAANDPEIHCWENVRRTEKNILIMHPDEDFVVVLGCRNDHLLLKTAYDIKPRRKQKMLDEMNNSSDPRA